LTYINLQLEYESLLTVGLPEEFEQLRRYARELEFDDEPDYEGVFQTLEYSPLSFTPAHRSASAFPLPGHKIRHEL
jgi:hypothetical protein